MASSRHTLLINGPTLNLIGTAESQISGSTNLHDVEQSAQTQTSSLSLHLTTLQSNHEDAVMDRIHQAAGFSSSLPPLLWSRSVAATPHHHNHKSTTEADPGAGENLSAIIINNPGTYTHTSVGIRDALGT